MSWAELMIWYLEYSPIYGFCTKTSRDDKDNNWDLIEVGAQVRVESAIGRGTLGYLRLGI